MRIAKQDQSRAPRSDPQIHTRLRIPGGAEKGSVRIRLEDATKTGFGKKPSNDGPPTSSKFRPRTRRFRMWDPQREGSAESDS
ncbi:hypothetical protein NL676_032123 [Syzygium grande]|nr:hypothetical protein NL676_032123 [Syzygium grande]